MSDMSVGSVKLSSGNLPAGVTKTPPNEGALDNPSGRIKPSGSDKGLLGNWNQLNSLERKDKVLELIFKFLVSPLSIASAVSSSWSFLLSHIFKGENETLDKIAEYSNRAAYFVNGLYGSLDNACSKNLVGTIGYGVVSLASIVGNKENLYYLKGPGSALDQLPAMAEELGYNEEIKKIYDIKEGEEKEFNKYKGYWDSVEKTLTGTRVVCKDIYREFMEKKSKGIFKALWEIFVTDKRKAEKNLVVSSIGMLIGSGMGIVPALRKAGSIIRDIFGMHADLGLVAKGFSANKAGNSIGSNLKYTLCGALYESGSIVDLIYRITGWDRSNLLAVGLDNAGFWFMNWANATDNKAARNSNYKQEEREVTPELPVAVSGLAGVNA